MSFPTRHPRVIRWGWRKSGVLPHPIGFGGWVTTLHTLQRCRVEISEVVCGCASFSLIFPNQNIPRVFQDTKRLERNYDIRVHRQGGAKILEQCECDAWIVRDGILPQKPDLHPLTNLDHVRDHTRTAPWVLKAKSPRKS